MERIEIIEYRDGRTAWRVVRSKAGRAEATKALIGKALLRLFDFLEAIGL